MRLSDFLDGVGHPVAYYPALAQPLGGVNAAILFGQIYYWLKRSTHELGVHKTMAELTRETGLSRTEQETARKALRRCGVLIETHRRLEHKVYFQLDLDRLEALMVERARAEEEGEGAAASASAESPHSPMQDSCIGGIGKPASGEAGNPQSRSGKSSIRGAANPAFVNGVKTTAETTAESSSNAHEAPPVDNSGPDLLPLLPDGEKPGPQPGASAAVAAPPTREAELVAALAALPRCGFDAATDRTLLLTWVGREVTTAELVTAHGRALAARARDGDDRAVFANFLARFVDEVLAERAPEAGGAPEWWAAGEREVCNEGYRLGVRPKKPDEPLHAYRVLVAKAAGKGPWIDWVVKHAERTNSPEFFRYVTETFGDALMPTDYYPS
ncbi:hypothetical protein [Paraburkholderia sp. J10-1]|uniref:hypothetical protein n=1 Tax=Paraburkholderia sp. J10-1 TaxID=2805430 RepID=UPI002AB7543E|nr:hypothetical protein [Paraburkholderia sp. J10-1]